MNVWVVYEDTGAYSDWSRVVVGVFTTQAAADDYAAKKNAPHRCPEPQRICYAAHYESSEAEFWVLDATPGLEEATA